MNRTVTSLNQREGSFFQFSFQNQINTMILWYFIRKAPTFCQFLKLFSSINPSLIWIPTEASYYVLSFASAQKTCVFRRRHRLFRKMVFKGSQRCFFRFPKFAIFSPSYKLKHGSWCLWWGFQIKERLMWKLGKNLWKLVKSRQKVEHWVKLLSMQGRLSLNWV